MHGGGAPPGGLHFTSLHCTELHPRSLDMLLAESRAPQERGARSLGGWGNPAAGTQAAHSLSRTRRWARAPDAAGLCNSREKLCNSEASRMFFPDGTLPAVIRALLLGLTCLTAVCDLAKGSADFSGQELHSVQYCLSVVLALSCLVSSFLCEEVSLSHPLLGSARPVPVACLGTHAPLFTSQIDYNTTRSTRKRPVAGLLSLPTVFLPSLTGATRH